MTRNYIRLAAFPLFALLLTACSKDDATQDQPPQQKATPVESTDVKK
ncbi:hypothetical protein [Prevotella sp. E13-27]|nr:hypothetical protein [Prevotella sp. E13-27]MCK8623402.1 hypothetical protein [Prevotella sp. E13-27]